MVNGPTCRPHPTGQGGEVRVEAGGMAAPPHRGREVVASPTLQVWPAGSSSLAHVHEAPHEAWVGRVWKGSPQSHLPLLGVTS